MKKYNETKKSFIWLLARFSLVLAILTITRASVAQNTIWKTVLNFEGLVPGTPVAGELLISSNVIYLTTFWGNTNNNADPAYYGFGTGTILRVNTDGTCFTNLYNFSPDDGDPYAVVNSDGANPYGGLILYSNFLYGTTTEGGSSGNGTIFKIDTGGGNFTAFYNFSAYSEAGNPNNPDGANPEATLIVASNALYGTASRGGSYGCGTVFKISPNGANFVTLHSFTDLGDPDPDGGFPIFGLVLCSNTLYGITTLGGSGSGDGGGVIYSVTTDGTVYSILHNFPTLAQNETNADGTGPLYHLVLVSNMLYGITSGGGVYGSGILFRINPDGSGYTNLFNFTYPPTSLTLSGNKLYGSMAGGFFIMNTDATGYVGFLFQNIIDNVLTGEPGFDDGVFSGNSFYAPGYKGILRIGPAQPVIDSIVRNTNDSVTLTCSGSPYFSYLTQSITNLLPPASWQTVSTNVADTNGNWQYTDYRLTNEIFGTFTNLIYSGGGSISNFNNTSYISGTNIWSGYVLQFPNMFYRAAGTP